MQANSERKQKVQLLLKGLRDRLPNEYAPPRAPARFDRDGRWRASS